MADRTPETIYDPKRERWFTGYVDPAGVVVEVISAKPSRDSQSMTSDANKHRNKHTQIADKVERMDAAADALNAHKLVADRMDPLRADLIRGRIANGENLSNSDERAYRVAEKRAALSAQLSALKAARRKGPNEVMIEAIRDAGAIKFGINN